MRGGRSSIEEATEGGLASSRRVVESLLMDSWRAWEPCIGGHESLESAVFQKRSFRPRWFSVLERRCQASRLSRHTYASLHTQCISSISSTSISIRPSRRCFPAPFSSSVESYIAAAVSSDLAPGQSAAPAPALALGPVVYCLLQQRPAAGHLVVAAPLAMYAGFDPSYGAGHRFSGE
jgi:hypothetical protein